MRDDGGTLQRPTVLPGQICLIEHDPEAALAPFEHDALTDTNVVLFERALGSLVIEILPLGSYAEPLPATPHAAGPALSRRALELAGEGWSVAQLVAASPGRGSRLHTVSPRGNGTVARLASPAYAFTGNGLAG